VKRTARGLGVYTQFADTRGADVRLQDSSEAGRRRAWLSSKGGSTLGQRQRELHEECKARKWQMPGDQIIGDDTSPHLTPAMARRLAKALLRFADGK
jgi:hypothetical protein